MKGGGSVNCTLLSTLYYVLYAVNCSVHCTLCNALYTVEFFLHWTLLCTLNTDFYTVHYSVQINKTMFPYMYSGVSSIYLCLIAGYLELVPDFPHQENADIAWLLEVLYSVLVRVGDHGSSRYSW